MTGTRRSAKKNVLEWAVFAASILLSLGAMGALAWEALTGSRTSAALFVRLDIARAEPAPHGGYQLPVVVENRGDETAESVRVELTVDGARVSELEFAFVPHGATREGVAFVPRDPAAGGLAVRVVSFRKP